MGWTTWSLGSFDEGSQLLLPVSLLLLLSSLPSSSLLLSLLSPLLVSLSLLFGEPNLVLQYCTERSPSLNSLTRRGLALASPGSFGGDGLDD